MDLIRLLSLVVLLRAGVGFTTSKPSSSGSGRYTQQVDQHEDFTTVSTSTYSCLLSPCPRWSYCDRANGHCKCRGGVFICNDVGHQIAISSWYCPSVDEATNITEFGLCLYNCFHHVEEYYSDNPSYVTLPSEYADWNEAICGRYSRTGMFCSKCKEDMYLQAYSYDMSCTACSGSWANWLKYVFSAFVPLTIFYIFILLFKINIPLSRFQGYVFYCQVMSCSIFMRESYLLLSKSESHSELFRLDQFFGSLYGIWNLDFFRVYDHNICFRSSPLTILSLDIVLAIYPLLLMAITYASITLYDRRFKPLALIGRPVTSLFSRFNSSLDNVKTSTIDAFATFMLLSNVKFLSVCFDLLAPLKVVDTENNSFRWALFYDASISYFSPEHLPYAIPAFIVLVIFVIFPILILIFYPFSFFQKCLTIFPRQLQMALFIFLDSFQGCYRDGTEAGTWDCRWFSAIPFITRFAVFSMYTVTITPMFPCLVTIIFVLTAVVTIIVDPFKPQLRYYQLDFVVYTIFFACFSAALVTKNFIDYSHHVTVLFYSLIVLTSTAFVLYTGASVSYSFTRHWKYCISCVTRFKSWRSG